MLVQQVEETTVVHKMSITTGLAEPHRAIIEHTPGLQPPLAQDVLQCQQGNPEPIIPATLHVALVQIVELTAVLPQEDRLLVGYQK